MNGVPIRLPPNDGMEAYEEREQMEETKNSSQARPDNDEFGHNNNKDLFKTK